MGHKYEYGVAYRDHYAGATPDYLTSERFQDYDSAQNWASNNIIDCFPTIYLIVDDKYVFHCTRSKVENLPYEIEYYQTTEWGQITTIVWWKNFIQEPTKFFHLCAGKLIT